MNVATVPLVEHLSLARLAKRVLAKQREYFTCPERMKKTFLAECRDLERRLNAASDKALSVEFETPSLFEKVGAT